MCGLSFISILLGFCVLFLCLERNLVSTSLLAGLAIVYSSADLCAANNKKVDLKGNKADCGIGERVVRREEGERLAREYNVAFMETSAKTGVNVEVSFMAVARELKSRKSTDPDEQAFNVQEFVREQTQKSSCPPCTT